MDSASLAMASAPLLVMERFVGDVQQAADIIALAGIIITQAKFRLVDARIHQARDTLELLFVGEARTASLSMVQADIRFPVCVLLTHSSSKLAIS